MNDKLKVGDYVEVLDPGLLKLTAVMGKFGTDAEPSNRGYIKELDYGEDNEVLVEFPIGDDPIEEHSQVAPYPRHMIRKL